MYDGDSSEEVDMNLAMMLCHIGFYWIFITNLILCILHLRTVRLNIEAVVQI